MSTHLDFRCKTCGDNAGLSDHRYGLHNELFLRVLHVSAYIRLLPKEMLHGELSQLPAFFAVHSGHDVVVENGYGQECLGAPDVWSDRSRFSQVSVREVEVASGFTVETNWDGGGLLNDTASDGAQATSIHTITETIAAADIPSHAATSHGFTITAEDVEAALGRGVLRAAAIKIAGFIDEPVAPTTMAELERVEPSDEACGPDGLVLLTGQVDPSLNGLYRVPGKASP